jgi:rifampin ADP-ribosylating transferase
VRGWRDDDVGPEREERRVTTSPNASGGAASADHVPVTYDTCALIAGPFFHGTKAVVEPGTALVAGYGSNFQDGRVSNNIYFSALVETAAWGAELATALAGLPGRGHIYVVEPLGPFEDDPNVTNKRFPGNPTESYRTRHPLRVIDEVLEWEGHEPEVLSGMLERLAALREQGLDVIED